MDKQFLNYLKKLDFDKLVSLWNTYGIEYCPDKHIYSREEFCKLYGVEAKENANMSASVKIKNRANYFYFDNDNIEECWNLASSPIHLEVLAEAIEEDYHEIWKECVSKYVNTHKLKEKSNI